MSFINVSLLRSCPLIIVTPQLGTAAGDNGANVSGLGVGDGVTVAVAVGDGVLVEIDVGDCVGVVVAVWDGVVEENGVGVAGAVARSVGVAEDGLSATSV